QHRSSNKVWTSISTGSLASSARLICCSSGSEDCIAIPVTGDQRVLPSHAVQCCCHKVAPMGYTLLSTAANVCYGAPNSCLSHAAPLNFQRLIVPGSSVYISSNRGRTSQPP